MRNFFFPIAILSTLVVFSSCNKEQKNIKLTMAEPNPEGSISAKVDHEFIKKVEELSNGSITIELHASGILGDNTAVLKAMTQPGSRGINIARLSPAAIANYGCTMHGLLGVPYTFKNHAHFWKFASSPVAEVILDEPYKAGIGVKGLFFMEEGFRHFFSTKPLNDIEDFEGEKIRTAGNSVMEGISLGMKGQSVNVAFTALYSALQTGKVSIAEQPLVNYLANDFHKVAPYMILDGHELGAAEVVIASETWDSLSKEQKEILVKAGKYAGEYCMNAVQEKEKEAKEILTAEGAKFTEVKDISKWQKACADVISETVRSNTAIYGEIINLAD